MKGFTLWFTGMSGSGKTTLAEKIQGILLERGVKTEILDGDVIRTNLSKGLGFSKEDHPALGVDHVQRHVERGLEQRLGVGFRIERPDHVVERQQPLAAGFQRGFFRFAEPSKQCTIQEVAPQVRVFDLLGFLV